MDLCPQIPPGRTVRVSIALLTQGVGGKGAFLRLRRETFDWRPRPLVSQTGAVETPPITGDSGAWVALDPLEIHSPVQPGDERLWIEVVLDGCGEARFSGMNIECILEDRMISGTRDGTSPRVFSGQVGKKVT